MNKIIFWLLAGLMTIFGVAYVITSNETAFTCCMLFAAAALVVLSNKLKSAQ
jgi:hypothetical protein